MDGARRASLAVVCRPITWPSVTSSASAIEGRAWLFAEPNINTDLIMPAAAFRLPREQQVKLIFSAVRPGWTDLVSPGDVLVGGRNF